jgi:hypothetical protein
MDEPLQIVEGLHPAIIDPETFYKANEVLVGRIRNMVFHLIKIVSFLWYQSRVEYRADCSAL